MAKRKSGIGGWLIVGLFIICVVQCTQSPKSSSSSTISPPALTSIRSPSSAPPAQVKTAEIRFVTATSLNMRSKPNTSASVISALPSGTSVNVEERQNGWLLVSLSPSVRGWISEQYTATTKPQRVYAPPAPISQPVQSASGLSCGSRRTCGQIGSCRAAQWYLQNCSWGGRLDRDSDGLACETLC